MLSCVAEIAVMAMTADDKKQAIFGMFDGLTSAVGVVAAGVVAGDLKQLITFALGLTIASALSMGAGEWLSDTDRNIHRASVMGLATGVGSFLLAIPFLFTHGPLASVGAVLLSIVALVIIAKAKGGSVRNYVETFTIFVVTAVVTIVAALLLGATG